MKVLIVGEVLSAAVIFHTAGHRWQFENAAKILSAAVEQSPYLTGAFSVADILAGHVVLWAKAARLPIDGALESYLANLRKHEAVDSAAEHEKQKKRSY